MYLTIKETKEENEVLSRIRITYRNLQSPLLSPPPLLPHEDPQCFNYPPPFPLIGSQFSVVPFELCWRRLTPHSFPLKTIMIPHCDTPGG